MKKEQVLDAFDEEIKEIVADQKALDAAWSALIEELGAGFDAAKYAIHARREGIYDKYESMYQEAED